jgi:hypothetical protein
MIVAAVRRSVLTTFSFALASSISAVALITVLGLISVATLLGSSATILPLLFITPTATVFIGLVSSMLSIATLSGTRGLVLLLLLSELSLGTYTNYGGILQHCSLTGFCRTSFKDSQILNVPSPENDKIINFVGGRDIRLCTTFSSIASYVLQGDS